MMQAGGLMCTSNVSPGFTPRPSLSAPRRGRLQRRRRRVAGVHAPAFVERTARTSGSASTSRVAGVHAPAFVERWLWLRTGRCSASVAGVHAPAFVERLRVLSAALRDSADVAGVHAPAFVER